MKILWLSPGKEDYQSDALFHGLRTLYGADVVDEIPYECMYTDGAKASYGRGFTMYNLLPRLDVDRTDIEAKLRAGYFERVIIGGDWIYNPDKLYRSEPHVPHWQLIQDHVPLHRVAVIDGGDQPAVSPYVNMKLGVYFKRENTGKGLPIHFAMPEEKMRCGPLTDRNLWADYQPGQPYRYESEADYYDGYRHAWFALTTKKQGWDCLRHREIMACGCIPVFVNVHKMPQETAKDLPRWLLEKVMRENWPETNHSENTLAAAAEVLFQSCKRYSTTTALAKYVLENLG